jgi:hypothetical protein
VWVGDVAIEDVVRENRMEIEKKRDKQNVLLKEIERFKLANQLNTRFKAEKVRKPKIEYTEKYKDK